MTLTPRRAHLAARARAAWRPTRWPTNQLFRAYVLQCLDGDTLDLCLLEPAQRQGEIIRVRLWAIDAPEMQGATLVNATIARTHLQMLVDHRWVQFRPRRAWPDLYGRVLADLYIQQLNVRNILLKNPLFRPWPAPTRSFQTQLCIPHPRVQEQNRGTLQTE
jgi:endonuclease YncB( thermonuclease family)